MTTKTTPRPEVIQTTVETPTYPPYLRWVIITVAALIVAAGLAFAFGTSDETVGTVGELTGPTPAGAISVEHATVVSDAVDWVAEFQRQNAIADGRDPDAIAVDWAGDTMERQELRQLELAP